MALIWDVDGVIITPEMSEALDEITALYEGSLNGASGMRAFAAMLKASPYFDEVRARSIAQEYEQKGPPSIL